MNEKFIVLSLHIAPAAAAPMQTVNSVQAVVGLGLQGDRYFNKVGTFSKDPGSGRDVTLIESEAIEALRRDYKIEIDDARARRNLVTRGVALNHLVGRRFSVGAVTLCGTALRSLRPSRKAHGAGGAPWFDAPRRLASGDRQRRRDQNWRCYYSAGQLTARPEKSVE